MLLGRDALAACATVLCIASAAAIGLDAASEAVEGAEVIAGGAVAEGTTAGGEPVLQGDVMNEGRGTVESGIGVRAGDNSELNPTPVDTALPTSAACRRRFRAMSNGHRASCETSS